MSIFSDIKDTLFGSAPTVTEHSNLTPEQQKKLKDLLAGIDSGGQYDLSTAYGGDLSAGQNKLQGASLAALEQSAMNQVSPDNNFSTASNVLTGIANQTPEDLQTYFQRTIFDPTMQQVNEQLIPALTQRFKGQSGFGSDRMKQEQQLAQGVTTGIAGQVAQAIQDQQKLKLQAAQALPNVSSAATQNALALQYGGGVQQELDQAPLTAQYQEFVRQQKARAANVEAIIAALGIQPTTPVVSGGSGGLVGSFLGGGGGGALINKLL